MLAIFRIGLSRHARGALDITKELPRAVERVLSRLSLLPRSVQNFRSLRWVASILKANILALNQSSVARRRSAD